MVVTIPSVTWLNCALMVKLFPILHCQTTYNRYLSLHCFNLSLPSSVGVQMLSSAPPELTKRRMVAHLNLRQKKSKVLTLFRLRYFCEKDWKKFACVLDYHYTIMSTSLAAVPLCH